MRRVGVGGPISVGVGRIRTMAALVVYGAALSIEVGVAAGGIVSSPGPAGPIGFGQGAGKTLSAPRVLTSEEIAASNSVGGDNGLLIMGRKAVSALRQSEQQMLAMEVSATQDANDAANANPNTGVTELGPALGPALSAFAARLKQDAALVNGEAARLENLLPGLPAGSAGQIISSIAFEYGTELAGLPSGLPSWWSGANRDKMTQSVNQLVEGSVVSELEAFALAERIAYQRSRAHGSTPASPPPKASSLFDHAVNLNASESDVSCPAAAFCVTLDSGGDYFTRDRVGWSTNGPDLAAPAQIDTHSTPGLAVFGANALSCASPSFCAAVDTTGHATLWDGSAWDQRPGLIMPGTEGGALVSCPTVSFCLAVGAPGRRSTEYASTFNGAAWSAPRPTGVTQRFASLSCATAKLCWATDSIGRLLADRDGNWTVPNLSFQRDLISVSCPTAGFCAAAGSDQAWTLDNGSWSPPATFASKADRLLPDLVSCASPQFCAIVGTIIAPGKPVFASIFDGKHWSSAAPTKRHTNLPIEGLSCATAQFCMAVGDGSAATSCVQHGRTTTCRHLAATDDVLWARTTDPSRARSQALARLEAHRLDKALLV